MTTLYDSLDERANLTNRLNGLVNDITNKIHNKYQLYNNIKSREMEEKLKRIDELKSRIDTRTSLIEKVDKEARVKDLYITLSWYFIYVIMLLVFPWLLYMANVISYRPFIYIVLIVIFGYIGYFAWTVNQYFFKKNAGIPTQNEVVKELDYITDNIYKEGKRLEKEAKQFIYNNCSCDDKHKKNHHHDKNGKTIRPIAPNNTVDFQYENPDLQGYYYNDYGTPNQKIVPMINDEEAKNNTIPNKYFKIKWNSERDIPSAAELKYCDTLTPDEKCIDRNSICCSLPKAYASKPKGESGSCSRGSDEDSEKYGKGRNETWTMGL